jgi:hypothetical protein
MRVCKFEFTCYARDPHPPLALAASPCRERRSWNEEGNAYDVRCLQ